MDFLKKMNLHAEVVYNGFDETLFSPLDTPSSQFVISYVGRLYEQRMQDPTLLMNTLKNLDIDLRVRWYTNTDGRNRIRMLAQQYRVEKYMEYYDYVPPTQVPQLLHESSILMVLTNIAAISGAHGIMTTKFFEALGVEKPVLCVPSDKECLAQVIQETNAGLAATSAEEIKDFILEKYDEWKQNGFTRQPVNQEAKRLFSRQYQAQQFEQILFNAIHA
jgi:glycosyltransferase involved in cell wall biosynthesis